MELAQDTPPIDNRFDLIDLPFAVDCCVLLNIITIMSPSREMGGRSDARTAMTYLLEVFSLALSGHYDRSNHQCKEHRPGNRTRGRVWRPSG